MVGIVVNEFGPSDRKREEIRVRRDLFESVVKAVEGSFVEANMLKPTRSEVDERIKIAESLALECYFDKKWSLMRVGDNILPLLRAKLLGLQNQVNPDTMDQGGKRATWGVEEPKKT